MDFAWVVDALRRGLKVTRKSWAGDPPLFLYLDKEENVTKRYTGTSIDDEWSPTYEDMYLAKDWEEYVEPKKAAPAKSTQEDLPVWPEVNADGYARMSKDSDVVIHDGVYRSPKKKPMFGNTKLTLDENGPNMGDTMTVEEYQRMHSGQAVEDTPELSAEDKRRAKLLAEIFIQLLREDLFHHDIPQCRKPVKEPELDKVDRIVCAISDIAQFADDLAEGASEQLGIKISKRDILAAIADAIIQADETGTPVKDLLQNAYEKALKKAESDHV